MRLRERVNVRKGSLALQALGARSPAAREAQRGSVSVTKGWAAESSAAGNPNERRTEKQFLDWGIRRL